MRVQPFTIAIEDSTLTDPHQRLNAARFPGNVDEDSWNYGTSPAYMNELVKYWRPHLYYTYHFAATEE
jgi:hypothetical protein